MRQLLQPWPLLMLFAIMQTSDTRPKVMDGRGRTVPATANRWFRRNWLGLSEINVDHIVYIMYLCINLIEWREESQLRTGKTNGK